MLDPLSRPRELPLAARVDHGDTSDFTVYSDRFGGYSGASGREVASQLVSRRHR